MIIFYCLNNIAYLIIQLTSSLLFVPALVLHLLVDSPNFAFQSYSYHQHHNYEDSRQSAEEVEFGLVFLVYSGDHLIVEDQMYPVGRGRDAADKP